MIWRSFLLSYQRESSSSSNLAAAKKDTRSPTNKSIPYKSYHTNPTIQIPLQQKSSPYSLVKKSNLHWYPMAFFKAPKSQKENVCSCSKCYNTLNIYCFSHLPYLCMILIVKVTLFIFYWVGHLSCSSFVAPGPLLANGTCNLRLYLSLF